MARVETGQMEFTIGPENTLVQLSTPDQPAVCEKEYRVSSLITFSKLEKQILGEGRPASEYRFDASIAVGAAIDYFLVPANFIYRFRDNYCFPEELYWEWKIDDVFARFYPTGWGYQEILGLLKKYRPQFSRSLTPHNIALERGNIKRALLPLWQEIARKFNLDSLHLQGATQIKEGSLLPSGETASKESISKIGQRIVTRRFDALVDDDKNYTYIAKPNCLLILEYEGEPIHLHVQPDFIKRLREKRKSTQKRHIVTKRIVGDIKDSDKKDLGDFSTPFGQVMLVYNWLLLQIAQRFKTNQLTWVRLENGQLQRVFLISQEAKNPVSEDKIETNLAFLHEEGSQIFTPMPKLTNTSKELAETILKRTISRLRESKFEQFN